MDPNLVESRLEQPRAFDLFVKEGKHPEWLG